MLTKYMVPSARQRRLVLEQLDRDRLVGLCAAFSVDDIADRRSKVSYIDALVRSRDIDFASLVAKLKRHELQAIRDVLRRGNDRQGRGALLKQILSIEGDDSSEKRAPARNSNSEFALTSPMPKEVAGQPPRRSGSSGAGAKRTSVASYLAPMQQMPMFSPSVSSASPFVKWVGGKRQLLRSLLPHVPSSFGTYYEPFVGGGALFFHLSPRRAVLGDSNERLVRAYRGVQTHVEQVITMLRSYPHTKKFYLELREKNIDTCSDEDVAAWLIYLNKTGYNGLYRVNAHNGFNVPYGDYERPNTCDADTMRACARALRDVTLKHGDFEETTSGASEGDFVYFDPPYVPCSISSYFTSYTAAGFGLKQQERLRDVALRLKRRGVNVLLSNSATAIVEHLYNRDFELVPVLAKRRVNRDTSARGAVREYLIK